MHSHKDNRGGSIVSYQVRVLELFYHLDIIKLDVEVLVYTFQNALELDVVFELHGDLMVDESLEETSRIPKESVSVSIW